ncbi:MAG: alpha/beta hydrolase [Candidatus Shapirobacteria bacterium]|nr:alpha/beta hydrolase [Candidatus Shapirobacteria bacterium]
MRTIFEIKGEGRILVLLHGWSLGMSKDKYSELIDLLSRKYKVLSLNFPGFGGTNTPIEPWSVTDYAEWLADFFKKQKIEPEIIIGHSFGGRVLIKGVSLGLINPKKIVLLASAGIERKSFWVKLLAVMSSFVPKLFKRWMVFGSKDLREADGVMRETMKLVVGENLERDMSKIKVPTLLIWGDEDRTTPLWQGRLINDLIKGSELMIIKGANHGLPYKEVSKVTNLIINWLKK